MIDIFSRTVIVIEVIELQSVKLVNYVQHQSNCIQLTQRCDKVSIMKSTLSTLIIENKPENNQKVSSFFHFNNQM